MTHDPAPKWNPAEQYCCAPEHQLVTCRLVGKCRVRENLCKPLLREDASKKVLALKHNDKVLVYIAENGTIRLD